MKWFADYHHGGLYHSLILLAKRLEAEIYRPIGESWFNEGYFKIAEPYGNHPDTIKQYLAVDQYEPYYGPNNAIKDNKEGLYTVQDLAHETLYQVMTLERFKETKFDVVICSYGPHIPSWLELKEKYQPQAKFIMQVGNHGWEQYYPLVNNLLASCNLDHHQPIHSIVYHQEFPLDVFKPVISSDSRRITSFVNCLPRADYYNELKQALPEYGFRAYGAGSPDDAITGQSQIALKMQVSAFGYHVKPGGDGYGHILHNWFAVGRPVLTFIEDYKGKLGGDLLIPAVTCINLSGNPQKDADYIRSIGDKEYYGMVQSVQNRFRQIVDFDKEGEDLRQFFETLV